VRDADEVQAAGRDARGHDPDPPGDVDARREQRAALVDPVAGAGGEVSARGELGEEHPDVDRDQRHRDRVDPPRADTGDRALHRRGRLADSLRLAGVLRAAQADRSRSHALVTDGTFALRTRQTRLAVRMSIAVARGVHRASVSA